ncbi:hypothetical protein G7046_g1783 [Stylonectria norvegica]|nr:hypothetical protein G7046_g1783 [Stylonectria norvegica]
MASLLRRLPWFGRPWKPLTFSSTKFRQIALGEKIEEELLPDYLASHYYPARIGEVLGDRYQLVGKLGFGASSTVWLARDLNGRRHVALKLFIHSQSMGEEVDHELTIYKRIAACSANHPGRGAVRELLDSFDVAGPDGSHRCLVHPPLLESVLDFLYRNPVMRLPPTVLAFILLRLFLALDFLHTECKIIHTDIKADNIMFDVKDDSIFDTFEEAELVNPTPRKVLDGRTIYVSRQLQSPQGWGAPVLCDFGSAVFGDTKHVEAIQPQIYRSPEVILEAPWSYNVDIWNTGCMAWGLFESFHLFSGHDPEAQSYRRRTHLSEIVVLLGKPPQALLESGAASHQFFTDECVMRDDIKIPESMTLKDRETTLVGETQTRFLDMMHRMVHWDPSKRASAKVLAEHKWIIEYTRKKDLDAHDGYPKLARWMAPCENYSLFREYRYLYTRSMLHLQDEVRSLEEELFRLDNDDNSWNPLILCQRVPYPKAEYDPQLPEVVRRLARRGDLMDRISAKLKEYGEVVCIAHKMRRIPRPTAKDKKSFIQFWNDEVQKLPVEEETPLSDTNDLMKVATESENAWLDRQLHKLIDSLDWPILDRFLQAKGDDGNASKPNPSETNRGTAMKPKMGRNVVLCVSRLRAFTMTIMIGMMMLLLTAPLYPLFYWSRVEKLDAKTMAAIMLLQTSCTCVFGVVLRLCTTAKRHEIFTASATYMAILVVFMGQSR